MIDFMGATITLDVGFLLMREIEDRFKIIALIGEAQCRLGGGGAPSRQ
jgi:hypothetical protein